MNIFEEGELRREATIRKVRIVRLEGTREVAREVEHYNLDAIQGGEGIEEAAEAEETQAAKIMSTAVLSFTAACLFAPRRAAAVG